MTCHIKLDLGDCLRVSIDKYVILTTILCLVVFVGEICTYAPVHEYDTDAEWSESSVDFTVSSSGSDVYSALLLDHKGSSPVETIYVFMDENYLTHYNTVVETQDIGYVDQEYYAEQISKVLAIRGFTSVRICDSSELEALIKSTIEDPRGYGIVVGSYAMPSAIYSGHYDDPIMKWIGGGGTLYWFGSEIGKFYSDPNGLWEVQDNQELFFGKKCINTSDVELGTELVNSPFTDALSLKNSNIKFALNADGLMNGLEMGYTSCGYSSISMASVGQGSVCIFGGSFDIKQMDDIGQIIASGITPSTTIVDIVESNVTRGKSTGSMNYECDNPYLYIYIGGTYTKYGELHHD